MNIKSKHSKKHNNKHSVVVTYGLKIGLMSALLLGLVGCGNNKVSQDLKNSVKANQMASNLMAWETSEAHPENVFSNWRAEAAEGAAQKEKIADEICEHLPQLDGQSLTVFEHEIANPENRDLLAECQELLQNNLENYYTSQRSGAGTNNFRFEPTVLKRDLSNGYYAVTADVGPKEVILTFDDGPSGAYTETILSALREVEAKAIFFALGKAVRANPNILKKVAADGHAIGSHSVNHPCMGCGKVSHESALAEIRGGHQAIYDTLGWVDPFFRFPYGSATPALKSFLRQNQVAEFFWAVDTEDWKAQSNETLVRNTMQRLNARGRGVLLFHDIQRKTAEVMPQLLRELYRNGYKIVLLESSNPNARYNSSLVRQNRPLP
ncbi:polysaccharide deacetylase family protein [Pseudobdellovibrio exovorus]|uniref:NodB homology domain-containing protein n=1 Tax=Pseudobdellovibrio exovorus JSS TaxID=1184267 RepID=M4VDH6_9BACT|nr:polysaccharide deacetylase family protein [Pseudobdellovibrio exovorus]AGH96081.1 hypothetical protein A11Q_1865 [Pseudobdellovibrio exovorus JSS]